VRRGSSPLRCHSRTVSAALVAGRRGGLPASRWPAELAVVSVFLRPMLLELRDRWQLGRAKATAVASGTLAAKDRVERRDGLVRGLSLVTEDPAYGRMLDT
jgi:hypothetical protein